MRRVTPSWRLSGYALVAAVLQATARRIGRPGRSVASSSRSRPSEPAASSRSRSMSALRRSAWAEPDAAIAPDPSGGTGDQHRLDLEHVAVADLAGERLRGIEH